MNSNGFLEEEKENKHVPECRRIMLLGKCGAGKSSSGNTILNKMVFESDMKLKRVTIHCKKKDGLVEDTPVAVIDTPGLFEKDRNKEEISREILKRVKLQEPGPHVFVYVIPLGRMTQEDQDTQALIEDMFGPRVWDYTIVLFTHGDRLEGKTINDIITESDDTLRNFIRKCSGGFHVFNNKNQEEQTQVVHFMEKIQTLVALNGGSHYKACFYPEQERLIRERQISILTERDGDIRRKEDDFKMHYQGKELKQKIKILWREEEEKARKVAENEMRNNWVLKALLFFLFPVVMLFGLVLQVSWIYLVTFLVTSIGMFIKVYSISLCKISWLSMKK